MAMKKEGSTVHVCAQPQVKASKRLNRGSSFCSLIPAFSSVAPSLCISALLLRAVSGDIWLPQIRRVCFGFEIAVFVGKFVALGVALEVILEP